MNSRTTVAEAVLRAFGQAGVEIVFGLPGVHNLAFWKCEGPEVPRIIGVRHEQTTVYAADGLARMTGGLGVALTTTGPGAANAVGAFGEAWASGSPVVLVASEISTGLMRPGVMRGVLHESRDQGAIFEPLAKAVYRPRTATEATEAVVDAIETALSWPRGPVYLDIPMDVLDELVEPPCVRTPVRVGVDADGLAAAVDLISAAESIVLWAGGGVPQSGAEADVVELAERLQAPVVTTFAGRGSIPASHPLCVTLPAAEPEVAALIGSADLMIAVGTDFDGTDTRNWSMPTAARLLVINTDEVDAVKNYEPDVAVIGDAALALQAINRRLPARGERSADADLGPLHRAGWARIVQEPGGGPARDLLDAIETVVADHDPAVVADMAIAGYWIGGYARFENSRRLQYAVGWGTLGFALPAAVGAAAARVRPVLVVCGDGGIMFAVGELAVLVQEDLPVTLLLVDDGGYGMLRYDQNHAGDHTNGVDLVRPDFCALAASFGIPAVEVAAGDPVLTAALDKALASGGPSVVVLRAHLDPPRTISARWHE